MCLPPARTPTAGYTVDHRVLDGLRARQRPPRVLPRCFPKWSCAGDCLHLARTGNGEFRGSDCVAE